VNQPLADNQGIDGYVADGVWNYYHFLSSSLSAITIEVDQVRTPSRPFYIYILIDWLRCGHGRRTATALRTATST